MANKPESDKQRNYTLMMLVIVYASSHVDRNIVGILGQAIKESLLISDTELGILTGLAFAAFYATLGMPMAMWADRHNRRNLISVSVALWSLATVMCAAAQNYWQLLIARMCVGVGEAGSSPPSHSMISDLFPPEKRATALAIFGTGANIGVLLGLLIGGWINEWLDWRWAFVVVGLPGFAIAWVVRFRVKEPKRGQFDGDSDVAAAPPLRKVFSVMLRSALMRNAVLGSTFIVFSAYGVGFWIAVYLVRVHEMSTGIAGTLLALIGGVIGGIGTLFSGWLADKLAVHNPGWRAWVIAGAFIISAPFSVGVYLLDDPFWVIALYVVPAFFGGAFIGPGFAIIQSNMPVEMRSVAAGITLFVLNILGLSLGPLLVGVISDMMSASMGVDSVRYGLLLMIVMTLIGSAFYIRAGFLLQRNGDRVPSA